MLPNKLTDRERQVYEQIANNPYISQHDLSQILALSRSTVANVISQLVQKNILLGRAYVLNHSRPVLCIGAANVDRKYHCLERFDYKTSNPVRSTASAGGVARNIAENLGRLGNRPTLITAAGRDADWEIIARASAEYIIMDGVLHLPDRNTGTYTAVLDEHGEMTMAFADMAIYDAVLPEEIRRHEKKWKQAECVIADLNCPQETLAFLLKEAAADHTPVAFITVSIPKMKRLPSDISGLTWLMTNVEESAAHFDIPIQNEAQWKGAVEHWLACGVRYVTVTWGKRGVMVGESGGSIRHYPAPALDTTVDVTGAGDAFSAAVLHAWLDGSPLSEAVHAGLKSAALCVQTTATVHTDLTTHLLKKQEEFL
ncbi:carbohydrate kinase [Halobacillus sp. KGW1]|uniref:carbohydrate kinase n=1 Tax=Halobacillus sp. KGW1 TaxID=1793726 RepID=UPI000785F860|nr:PfkB family carbohydrate kinase [Halobacillus sp. KGW1]